MCTQNTSIDIYHVLHVIVVVYTTLLRLCIRSVYSSNDKSEDNVLCYYLRMLVDRIFFFYSSIIIHLFSETCFTMLPKLASNL